MGLELLFALSIGGPFFRVAIRPIQDCFVSVTVAALDSVSIFDVGRFVNPKVKTFDVGAQISVEAGLKFLVLRNGERNASEFAKNFWLFRGTWTPMYPNK